MNQLQDRRVFGLLGEIVDGNPTEEVMQAAFHSAALPWKYASIPVPAGTFPAAVAAARQLGFAGLHITKPYKIGAVALMDRMTPAAAAIGAVNLVSHIDGLLVGDNTDGRGLVAAVRDSCRLEGASVVVLGAGGAARAVAVELALAGAREIVVVSRSDAAGESVVRALDANTGAVAHHEPWTTAYALPATADLVVNATSVGMSDHDERPDVDMSRLLPGTVVGDVVIATRPTAFLREASDRGLTTVPGNEMLVQQAAISFETWSGERPDERVLRQALEASLLSVRDQADAPPPGSAQAGSPAARRVVVLAPRNRLVGIVTGVRLDTLTALVDVEAGPFRLVSMVTRDHVDELGLMPGKPVVCRVKATDVTVDLVP